MFTGHQRLILSVAVSCNDRYVLSGGLDGTRLWDRESGKCLRHFDEHRAIRSVQFTTFEGFALTAGEDNNLRFWELETGDCLAILESHTGPVTSTGISKDGFYIVSGSEDNIVKIWELDWELEARESNQWDEGVLPYLEVFLNRKKPHSRIPFFKPSVPYWSEHDFRQLVRDLQYAGYGWISPDLIREKLLLIANHKK